MPRILALLALLAWLIILSPYPATVFMGGAAACLSLPVYRWLRARMSRIVAVSVYSTGLCACPRPWRAYAVSTNGGPRAGPFRPDWPKPSTACGTG